MPDSTGPVEIPSRCLMVPSSSSSCLVAPGEASTSNLFALNESQKITVPQIELEEKEELPVEPVEESALEHLYRSPYQVFVLSEYGRPIYVSCGFEEQLCALFALIGVFVNRVRHWNGDMLHSLSSRKLHAHFQYRKPLIFCIVSKSRAQLPAQVDVLFDQILSTISRKQLETVYEKRGDNYDLRRLLRGTDKYMDGCVSGWRSDLAQIASAIRVFPLQATDRDFLSTTVATSITNAKLEGVLFGIVLAHRQLVSLVRLKKYIIHQKDLHILINLVSNNKSWNVCALWTPICLPHFNDSGFVHAYISALWEGSSACIVLLSVDRNAFSSLHAVKEDVVAKLQLNSKITASLQSSISTPQPFSVNNIGTGSENLWHFIYKNRSSQQMCLSGARPPFISREERKYIVRSVSNVYDLLRSVEGFRIMFVKRRTDVLYVKVDDRYEVQCILTPCCPASQATIYCDRLLKALKSYETRYFITNTPSFQ